MTAADLVAALLMAALTAYALFGGADFGGGCWDLLAGDARRGYAVRKLVEHTLGPIWEANHVWLIFTVVLLWTGFPGVFAAVAATLYIPLTAAALGIIGRGAGFAFRKTSTSLGTQRLFGAGFAFSSVVTPFCFGAAAGAIASGRVPPEIGAGDLVRSWVNPTSVAVGVLAVGVCAYLAAVFLTRDSQRHAPELTEPIRRRALAAGVATGGLAAVGMVVIATDAPWLAERLREPLPAALVLVSVVAGLASLWLLYRRRFLAVRITAGLAAAAVLWAWAAAQYPVMLPPGVTVQQAAAQSTVLRAVLGSTTVAALVLLPSLWWMLRLFQAGEQDRRRTS